MSKENSLLRQVVEQGLKENGLWYFGHPYTCYDIVPQKYLIQEAQYQLCLQRTIKLIEAGWTVFSPIVHSHPIQLNSLGLLCHSRRDDMDLHRFMMNIDLVILRETNFCGLILAPGWEDSKGCNTEEEIFVNEQKPVLNYTDLVVMDI